MAASRLVQPQRALKRRISRRILSRRDIFCQILLFGVVRCGVSLGVLGACGLAACGSGPPCTGLCGLGAGRFGGEPEHPAAHGRQIHRKGVVPAIDAAVGGVEGLGLRLVRTAPAGGFGVQQLFCPGGEAQIERELFVGVFWVFMTQRMVWPAPLRSHAYTPSSRLSLATHSKHRGSYSPA